MIEPVEGEIARRYHENGIPFEAERRLVPANEGPVFMQALVQPSRTSYTRFVDESRRDEAALTAPARGVQASVRPGSAGPSGSAVSSMPRCDKAAAQRRNSASTSGVLADARTGRGRGAPADRLGHLGGETTLEDERHGPVDPVGEVVDHAGLVPPPLLGEHEHVLVTVGADEHDVDDGVVAAVGEVGEVVDVAAAHRRRA